MTVKLGDRIKQTTTTSGDDTIVLSGTPSSFKPFSSVLSSGDTTYYCIENGSSFEVGLGTYGLGGPDTLSRDIVFSSSTGSKLDLSGRSFVFITVPAEKTAHLGSSGILDINLNYLSDVNISAVSSGNILYHNGSGFVNVNPGNILFRDTGDSSGNIPVIGSGGKLSIDLIPNSTGTVSSVAGRTGNVILTSSDITDFGSMASQSSGNVYITGGSITGITDLSIGDGGTGASTASGARTNLGLGTLATQNATSVNISGGYIRGLSSPTASTQAATKGYVDTFLSGLRDFKESCKAATTGNITLSGLQLIDDYQTIANDRVLVKNQSTSSQNGIYLSKLTSWTRSTDVDASSEVTAGMYTYVERGVTNSGSSWVLATTGTITLGTTGLTFVKFNQPGGLSPLANLSDLTNIESGRANLGLRIGIDIPAYDHNHDTLYYTKSQADTSYQPKDTKLTAISELSSSADTISYFTGSGSVALSSFTSVARSFNSATSVSSQRDALSLGSAALLSSGDFASSGHSHDSLYYAKSYIDSGVQPINSGLSSISSLSLTSGKMIYFSGVNQAATTDLTARARTFISASEQSEQISALGLGSIVTLNSGDVALSGHNHDDRYYTESEIGVLLSLYPSLGYIAGNYQPLDSGISNIANLSWSADKLMYFTGSDSVSTIDFGSGIRNFIVATPSGQRSLLGLGSASLSSSNDFISSGKIAGGSNVSVVTSGDWYVISASVDASGISGPVSSTNNQLVVFSGSSGNAVTGFTSSGLLLSNNGIASVVSYPLSNSGLSNSYFTINGNQVSLGGSISGLATTASGLNQFASTTSAALAAVISDEVGSGNLVFSNSPTLVTPNLGTPSTLVGTNISGTGNNFTAGSVVNPGLSGHIVTSGRLASLGSFTLSQLNAAISDADVSASGIGGDVAGPSSSVDSQIVVFSGSTGKTLKTIASTGLVVVTSGVVSTITAPTGTIVGNSDAQTLSNKTINGSSNTITNIANSSLVNSTISINGSGIGLGSGISGIATTASGLHQFASTTSLQLAGVISDEVGSGSLVFANSPTLINPVIGNATASSINRISLTQPANTGTISIFNSGTLATSGAFSITVAATGNSTFTVPMTGVLSTTSNSETISNKRHVRRITNITSSTGIIPDVSTTDQLNITALAADTTFMIPTGIPNDGDDLIIRVKDNGTARTITWNGIYRAVGITLPTTTVINKLLYVGAKYNFSDTKWDVLAIGKE